MSTPIIDGGPAFPVPVQDDRDCFGRFDSGYAGMSLRDWFAGQALAGMSVQRIGDDEPAHWHWPMLARAAYDAADAMLDARNGGAK